MITVLIGDVAKEFHIPADTLRYYDRIGLLSPRRQEGVRRYSQADLHKLAAIIKMKKLMFSLEEIKSILDADARIEQQLREKGLDRSAVMALSTQIDAKLKAVAALQQNLEEVKTELTTLADKIHSALGEEK